MRDIEELKKTYFEAKESQINLDYVVEVGGDKTPYRSYSLDVDPEAQAIIWKQINQRLQKINTSMVIKYDLTMELGREQIGTIDVQGTPDLLQKLIGITNQPNSKSLKIPKEDRRHVVAYVTSFHAVGHEKDIKIIKKLNFANILSKSKKRVSASLVEGKVKTVKPDIVVISPEAMDVVCFDKTAFIFNEPNFHYLFSGQEYLKGEIEKRKDVLNDVLEDSEKLSKYAYGNAGVTRGLYHLVTSGRLKRVKDSVEVERIDKKIREKHKLTDSVFKFTKEGKIICTDENARFVYLLLAEKYGENLMTKEDFIVGSTYSI